MKNSSLKFLFAPLLFLFAVSQLQAQATIRIMTIPYTKTGESRIITTELNDCVRTLITKIEEAGKDYDGLEFVSYKAALEKARIDDRWREGTQQDRKSLLIANENPTIYIEADLIQKSEGGKHWVNINLKAYRTSTSQLVTTKFFDSGRFNYDDCAALIGKAGMERGPTGAFKIDEFMQELKEETGTHAGLPISLEFMVDENSMYDFQIFLDDDRMLVEAIESVVEEYSLDGNVAPSISTKIVKFPSVVIPTMDEYKQQTASPSDFAMNVLRGLRGLKMEGETTPLRFSFDVTGSSIYFTLK